MTARSERGLILPLINVGAQRRAEHGTNSMNASLSPALRTRKQPAPASIGEFYPLTKKQAEHFNKEYPDYGGGDMFTGNPFPTKDNATAENRTFKVDYPPDKKVEEGGYNFDVYDAHGLWKAVSQSEEKLHPLRQVALSEADYELLRKEYESKSPDAPEPEGVQVDVQRVENIKGETKTTPHKDMNLEVWRIVLTDVCETYAKWHIDQAFHKFVHDLQDYYGHVAQPPWHDAVSGNTWWYREDQRTSVATTCCTMPPDRVRSFSDMVDETFFTLVNNAGMRVVNVDRNLEKIRFFVPL